MKILPMFWVQKTGGFCFNRSQLFDPSRLPALYLPTYLSLNRFSFTPKSVFAHYCLIPRQTVAIYPPPNYPPFLFIKLKTGTFYQNDRLLSRSRTNTTISMKTHPNLFLDSSNGCVFQTSVFGLYSGQNQSISIIASSKSHCQAFLLLQNQYNSQISKIWTNSVIEDVEIYAGINENRKLFLKFK